MNELVCQALGYDAVLYLPSLSQNHDWQQVCQQALRVFEDREMDLCLVFQGHDELPELAEEHSAWSDVAGDGEVEQGEEGHEEQEQHEEVEQEEEGHEEQEAVEVEVEVEVEGEDEVQEGGGDGDEWSDFSSRDPVLTLSLFGAVCFRACGTITLNLST